MSALLEIKEVSKSFPGVKALSAVSFSVKAGTTHALMGENGAGKSTLMKCLFGVYRKDSGHFYLNGEEISFKNSAEALSRGVAMVHQELNQAGKLSVAENLFLGRLPRLHPKLPFTNKAEAIRRSEELFASLSVRIDPRARIETLSVSQRQLVEIAKAVSYGAKIIVFDEPTSSLGTEEAELLFKIIEKLKGEGCGIIYISHKMEEILRISDEVTVMRDGCHIATKPASELTTEKIIKLMVGRDLSRRYPERLGKPGAPLFIAESLTDRYTALSDVSFTLHRGEILGIAGLDGSGRTELLENLFGLSTRKSGRLFLSGKEIFNRNPAEAIKNGFALVTEERRASGIFGILPITDNTVISSLRDFTRGPFLSPKKMKRVATDYIKRLRVKTPSEKTKIRSLSGGNQQKVIFSRWMLTEPTVLLLDEPTRGIDVGAKYEIYQLIVELAQSGRGVILVSSEMPELIGLCDRILVMCDGKHAGTVSGGSSEEEIMALATKYL